MRVPGPSMLPPRRVFRSRLSGVVLTLACMSGVAVVPGRTADARSLGEITDIVVSRDADGTTVVRVTADRPFRERDFSVFHLLQTPPRAVLRLRGVEAPYEPTEIPVGDDHVARITVGHDSRRDPPELNLILELASREARIADVRLEGRQLVARVAGGAGPGAGAASVTAVPSPAATASPAAAAATASPPGTPPATPSPTPTVAPTRSPTPTVTPTPTPTPPPTATPRPQPSPTTRAEGRRSRRIAEAPATVGAPVRTGPTTLYRAPEASEGTPASPGARSPSARTTRIEEIVVSQRPDGATLLRVTLADPLGGRGIRHRREPGDHLRHEILLQGVELGSVPGSIEVGRPNLRGLELSPTEDRGVSELRLTLLLSSEGVAVKRIAFQGTDVVVLLEPSPGQ